MEYFGFVGPYGFLETYDTEYLSNSNDPDVSTSCFVIHVLHSYFIVLPSVLS